MEYQDITVSVAGGVSNDTSFRNREVAARYFEITMSGYLYLVILFKRSCNTKRKHMLWRMAATIYGT